MTTISLRQAFGEALIALGEREENFVVFDADVAGGTCTNLFRDRFPSRFIQCGIAEQNMMGAAAGFSVTGVVPFVTCYAVFASMRAAEQVRNGIAYPRFNVKIVSSHVGLDVGPDGVSHMAMEDLAIFRAIPNMVVISPADESEVYQATEAIYRYDGPVYMRTGRSPVPDVHSKAYRFEIGKGVVLEEGKDVAIVATGIMVHRALEARRVLKNRGILATVINVSTLKPMDAKLMMRYATTCGAVVTCEDHTMHGGLFGAVVEALSEHPAPVRPIAVRDRFAESGEPDDLAKKYKIDVDAIVDTVCDFLGSNRS